MAEAHRASTGMKPAHTDTHMCDILPLSISLSLSLLVILPLTVSISLSLTHFFPFTLSFPLAQNTQAQLNVTMTAVAITLVSLESPNGQAQGEDSSDPTVGIGYNYALWV